MNTVRVCLFGEFQIQWGEENLTDLYPRKTQELLCYLLLYRDRCHPRENLASLLWGDTSTTLSKKYLRQALWQFQNTLRSQIELVHHDVLLVDAERLRINPDADLWLDVAVFERAIVRTQGIAGATLDTQQAQTLSSAADLYRGDLLEGWFDDWCLYERERLQNMYLSLLDKIMDYCEAHNECEIGLDIGSRILRYDGARERTHRRLMRLYYLSGDRTAALRQYDRCVRALHRELAVKPAARTTALFQQIRTERFAGPPESPLTDPLTNSSSIPQWTETVEQLRHLQRSLTRVQDELQRAIHVAEAAMRD